MLRLTGCGPPKSIRWKNSSSIHNVVLSAQQPHFDLIRTRLVIAVRTASCQIRRTQILSLSARASHHRAKPYLDMSRDNTVNFRTVHFITCRAASPIPVLPSFPWLAHPRLVPELFCAYSDHCLLPIPYLPRIRQSCSNCHCVIVDNETEVRKFSGPVILPCMYRARRLKRDSYAGPSEYSKS